MCQESNINNVGLSGMELPLRIFSYIGILHWGDGALGDMEMRGKTIPLWRLFIVYLKIGLVGFGPTLAAETQKHLVKELKWIREQDFIDGLALAQLLPGATFVSLTVYIGYRLRGILGALTSFVALLLLPFIIMLLLSYIYFTYGSIEQVSMLFKGVAVVVVGLIAHALMQIGKSLITDVAGIMIALAAVGVMVYCSNIFMVLFLAAGSGIILYYRPLKRQDKLVTKADNCSQLNGVAVPVKQIILLGALLTGIGYSASFQPILLQLGLVFFRMGALLFGGGFSMIPFIQQEVVMNYNWLTFDEFIVGIALGQVTPGPVLITATFVGYKVAGVSGAVAATLGIFLPSLFLVPATAEIHQKIRNNLWVQAAIKGIVAALVGMMLVVIVNLAKHSLVDLPSILLAVGILGVLKFSKLDTIWIIIGGTLTYGLYWSQ